MTNENEAPYEVSVWAFGLDEAAREALYDRVAEAAHSLGEQVTVVGGHAVTSPGKGGQ